MTQARRRPSSGNAAPQPATTGQAGVGNSQTASRLMDQATAGPTAEVPHRSAMESAFGLDFSDVTAHVGAGDALGSMGADAAARGSEVAFSDAAPSKQLVAHELAHVVQSRNAGGAAPVSPKGVSSPSDASEREADAAASAVSTGQPVSVTGTPGAGIQLHPGEHAASGGAGGTTTAPAPTHVGPLAEATEADVQAAETFLGQGAVGPNSLVPTSGMGGFDATFTPTADGACTLAIQIRAAVQFINPVTDAGGQAVASHSDYQPIADALNAAPAARRAAILPEFQWSSAEADRAAWLTRLETQVQTTWDNQHQFHVHRPGWGWIGTDVDVDVVVNARDTREANDHLAVEAVKFPTGRNLYGWGADLYSWCAEGDTDNAFDQTMRIASTDVDARPDNLLHDWIVPFGEGATTPTADGIRRVDLFARTFQGDPNNPASHALDISLDAFASASGTAEANQRISERRLAWVKARLAAQGFTKMRERVADNAWGSSTATGTTDREEDRRVVISIANGASQVLASHEFGHAFGLGDQYATQDKRGRNTAISGTGARTGSEAAHAGMTENMLDANGARLPGAIYENNDSIMSGGNEVRAEHYSTFHEALRTLTNIGDWALGARSAKPTFPADPASSGG